MLWFKIVATFFLALDVLYYYGLREENNVHILDVLVHIFLIVGIWVWL